MTRVSKRDRSITTVDSKSVVLLQVYNIHGGQAAVSHPLEINTYVWQQYTVKNSVLSNTPFSVPKLAGCIGAPQGCSSICSQSTTPKGVIDTDPTPKGVIYADPTHKGVIYTDSTHKGVILH